MNLTIEKIYGYIGSALFCAILLLLLWFSILKTTIPTGEEGVLVSFGNVDEASGTFEPDNMENNDIEASVESIEPVVPETSPQLVPPPAQATITQNIEQTVALEAAKKKKEEEKRQQKEQEEQKREEEAERQRREAEQKRQQNINNLVGGAFGAGNTNTPATGQGTGSGEGNQGNPQGSSDGRSNTGSSGYGDFSLAGRSLGPGGLPRPSYSIQEEGLIVIDITVNKNGDVILATIGKGTNIDNSTMRQSALDAAKKAKFNAISGNENQSGKITYRYYLR